jgi:glutathione synthase/RimK-type ligase-like ATP-grasp enzyme
MLMGPVSSPTRRSLRVIGRRGSARFGGVENKLVQLAAARAAGFRVPRTLVSHDPDQIRRFCAELEGRAVLKVVRGTVRSQLFTLVVTPEHLADDDALRLCPTIFQEYVPGSRHIRALCCGDEVHAATIESADLDWRQDLRVPMAPYEVDPPTRRRLARLLELLGLRMGVADIKIDDAGDLVCLELNPQGQFLWVEGLTGMDLTSAFCGFLRREALAAARAVR